MALCPARAELSKNPTGWETRSHFSPRPSSQGSLQGLGQDRGAEGTVRLPQEPSPSRTGSVGRVSRKLPWLAGGSTAGPPKTLVAAGLLSQGV